MVKHVSVSIASYSRLLSGYNGRYLSSQQASMIIFKSTNRLSQTLKSILMKRRISSFIFLLFISTITFGQEKSTLVIIRDTGYFGSLARLSSFSNNMFIGKIPNKSITKIEVEPGINTFNFQYYGRKKSNPKRTKATIKVEAGKTYYVVAIQKVGFLYSTIQTVEVTKNSAAELTPKLKPNVIKL